MGLFKSTLVLCFFFSITSYGAVEQFRILRGTSNNFDIRVNQDAWGVMAGPNATGTNQVFNSCGIVPPEVGGVFEITPCHPQRVNGDTDIVVNFIETGDFSPARQVYAVYNLLNTSGTGGGVQTGELVKLAESSQIYLPNQQAQISIQWREICEALNGQMSPDGFCTSDGTDTGAFVSGNLNVDIGIWTGADFGLVSSQPVTFRLYNAAPELGIMDFNTEPCDVPPPADPSLPAKTGFCDIGLFPGDGGGFVTTDEGPGPSTRLVNPGAGITYTDVRTGQTETLRYTALRLYFAESPDLLLPFNDIDREDFPLQSTSPLVFEEDSFSRLQNGVRYFFRAASIDESGTVSQFFSDDYCPDINVCPSITPSEVAGVIQESSCFITTATYGSQSAHQVQTFQKFRERFLRSSNLGQKIINLYEAYGPHGAVFLNNHSYFKPAVRMALFPLYVFAQSSLNFGFFFTTGLALALILTLLLFLRQHLFKKEQI